MEWKAAGRIVGVLVLVQTVAGALNLQVVTAPLFAEGGYLVNAAPHTLRLGGSVLLALLGGCMTIAIAAMTYPVLRDRSEQWALAFLGFSLVGVTLTAMEQVGLLAMREYSAIYVAADADQQSLLESLKVAGSALRNGVHYVGLLSFGVLMGVWHLCLLRFKLLPWPIPSFGLAAVCLQLYSISQPVLGGEVSFALLAPMGLAQLLLGGALLVWGFRSAPSRAAQN